MAVRIIADSASDIPQETAKKWGITILPLNVRFGDEEFQDGVTLSNREFYEKLIETDEIPKTSQIPPFTYEEAFREAVDNGDEVICFTLSSGLSGCFQSANIAADDFEDKVTVLDSGQVCISYYILVEYAVRLRDEGKSKDEIVSLLKEKIKTVKVLAVFDTLEYLKLGGRLSGAAAFAGNMLSIKPVITIEGGLVQVIGKARGSKNGNNMLMQNVKNSGGIDFSMPVCLGYSGLSDDMLRKYINDSASLYEGKTESLNVVTVGSTIGTYAGPGAIAVAFFPMNA
ncbi:MAG: DegV family protein [Lachnospiraceae bacterium]|nr:DegV family protein [Lachnospiraceae bacterium]